MATKQDQLNELPPEDQRSRREFIKKSSLLVAGGAVTTGLSVQQGVHAGTDETIRIGLVGCGTRGTGAASQALNTEGPVQLVAVGDAFEHRLQQCLRGVKGHHPDRVDVPPERRFVGFDAYQKVLDQDIDLVILATPPGFRPIHFEAAVAAGKHVFLEKPVAVDPPGVRRVLAASQVAKEHHLAVGVGLQRRHEPRYIETIDRLRDGAIGEILLTRVYWNAGGVWDRPRESGETEMRYQMRNWYYFNWLCGDHIVEQHIHNLDVSNWLKNAYPVTAQGQGGRQVRTEPKYGQIFDHHMVEYTYADGTKMLSQCRHVRGAWPSVSEHAHGTRGKATISAATIYDSSGEKTWRFGKGGGNGHQQELHDLFASLRNGQIPNEGEYGALSTMTAIMGRLATYSGQVIHWEEALQSELDLSPETYAFDATPPVVPDADGFYPVAVPGITRVI